MKDFARIEKEAHAIGMPVIAWVYPRGKNLEGKSEKELLAYSCRVGLETGADIVKVHWSGDLENLKWAVKSAGKTKVVVAGGAKTDEKNLLQNVSEAMKSGAIGVAIGRNIWQHEKPLELAKKIKKIIWK